MRLTRDHPQHRAQIQRGDRISSNLRVDFSIFTKGFGLAESLGRSAVAEERLWTFGGYYGDESTRVTLRATPFLLLHIWPDRREWWGYHRGHLQLGQKQVFIKANASPWVGEGQTLKCHRCVVGTSDRNLRRESGALPHK